MTSRKTNKRSNLKAGTAVARNPDAKRDAILAGAQKVFLKVGFGAASMDAVATASGVSKMTVYRHYKSKGRLFGGLIRGLCDQIVGDDPELDLQMQVQDVLRQYARRTIKLFFAPGTVGLHRIVIAESGRFPELGRLFYQSGPEASIVPLERYLTRLAQRRRISVKDTRRTAEEFLELLRGYAHLRVLLGIKPAPSNQDLDRRVEGAVTHLLTVLGMRPR
jgi:TetR/AcrR family transcriptional repressor of mexJK operon